MMTGWRDGWVQQSITKFGWSVTMRPIPEDDFAKIWVGWDIN